MVVSREIGKDDFTSGGSVGIRVTKDVIATLRRPRPKKKEVKGIEIPIDMPQDGLTVGTGTNKQTV